MASPLRILEPKVYSGPYAGPEYHQYWDHGYMPKVYRWTVYIRQANTPWMVAASSHRHRFKWQARRWANRWLKECG